MSSSKAETCTEAGVQCRGYPLVSVLQNYRPSPRPQPACSNWQGGRRISVKSTLGSPPRLQAWKPAEPTLASSCVSFTGAYAAHWPSQTCCSFQNHDPACTPSSQAWGRPGRPLLLPSPEATKHLEPTCIHLPRPPRGPYYCCCGSLSLPALLPCRLPSAGPFTSPLQLSEAGPTFRKLTWT